MYRPMAHVERHKHATREQVYHVVEGEGLMDIDSENHVVRKHDFIFLPPGVEHSISNTALVDLVFLVVTSPVTDDAPSIQAYVPSTPASGSDISGRLRGRSKQPLKDTACDQAWFPHGGSDRPGATGIALLKAGNR